MIRRVIPTALALLCGLPMTGWSHDPAPPNTTGLTGNAGGIAPGGFVPDFRLTDHRGFTRQLFYESTVKAVVLVFTRTDSPRTLQTASALRALRTRFAASDVVIWQIDSNAAANPTKIAAEQTLFNNDTPVLLDEAQLVARELGATRELETFVLAAPPFTQLAYRGPLDNADPETLAAPTENYAADAIAAVLAGRPPAKPRVDLPAAAAALDLPSLPAFDYAKDVAPIVLRRCASCHSNGNIAPHVYSKFDDLALRADQIRADMLTKRMAPWHADSKFGVFANDVALTPGETATLHAWAQAGAPRGTGADPLVSAPPPPGGDWPLGPPDLVVTIPKQDLPARGTIDYRYLPVQVPTTSDRWLRAAVVKPGNARAVHHALVFDASQLELLLAGGLGGFFAGYVPGLQQTWFPGSTGKLLRAGSPIILQMHYTATGEAESDQTQVGFYFQPAPPTLTLQTKAAFNINLNIPPGNADAPYEATFVPSATRDVLLYELNPHMHYRGKRFKFEALYPGGATEVLLNVPHYDFAWQSSYRLAQPKRLPAGTTLRISGAFDNSEQNPDNPDPRATVRFGEQTSDEMFIGYVNYAELPAATTTLPVVLGENLRAAGRVGESLSVSVGGAAATTYSTVSALPAGLRLDPRTGVLSGTPVAAGRHAIAIKGETASDATMVMLDLVISPGATTPVFTTQPRSVRGRAGESITLTASVAAAPKPAFTWFFNGVELRKTDEPILVLNNLTAASAGDYTCVATNSAGTTTSATATVSLGFSGLVNLSSRASVGTGANAVIPGITVRGDKPKTLLIRAAGPALAGFGVTGTLNNPVVNVFNAAGEKILVNDNWGEVPDGAALRATMTAQGAFALPEGSRDAALLATVPPGSYTVQVTGAGTGAAAQGVAIVEVYEADATPSTLVNLSCRARVGTGSDILIAGFTIGGTEPKRVLVRGIGPALGGLGVTGTLADPRLEIIRGGSSTVIASNDNWDASLAPTFSGVGAFALPAGSRDAALVITLEPGSYTAQVSGVGNTTGVAIVEVYELP